MSALPVFRRAAIHQQGHFAGTLEEAERGSWRFIYAPGYAGLPISLNLPVRSEPYEFDRFPPVFDGLLPEGLQLEALLRSRKIDRGDVFSQLLAVGADLVGSLTVTPHSDDTDEAWKTQANS
jgi:serine/threonine-protein kinase HipA